MSNRTNLSKSYNYTVTAASDNSAYLWSGHGLEDAPNPTIYIRSDDDITITNASGGHVMNLSSDDVSWGMTESNGQIVLISDANLLGEGSYTYVCSSHPAMTGKIKVSNAVVHGGPEDGYGTGLLPGNNLGGARASVSVDQIRTKINEIITKGGVGGTTSTGGGSISVSQNAPGSPSDGDLWWDEDTASLYVYFEDRDAWIQTNGAVGGGGASGGGDASIEVSATAPDPAEDGDLWFNTTQAELYVYVDAESAWIQTNGAVGGGGGGGGAGPRAYVAFDGTAADLTGSITNSFNVSSITDNAIGNYTINYTTPVSNPIISMSNEVRSSSPYFALYFAILQKTESSVKIGMGSNNIYYDHPYVSVTVH